ncbi:MAG: hypothetical protein RLZZ608_1598 [Actinomycetota bacterium]
MWFNETMLRRDLARPLFDGLRFDLDRKPTVAANEVMVVTSGRARSVERLAILLQRVSLAFVREVSESPVDRREADA